MIHSYSKEILLYKRKLSELRLMQKHYKFIQRTQYILPLPCECILSLINFIVNNEEKFKKNQQYIVIVLIQRINTILLPVAYPGILFGGDSTNSVEDRGHREQGSGGSSPLVRGSGGSCNLVQEISFHIAKFS